MISKRNIAIACGGNSAEHNVSLRSASSLYKHFDKDKFNVFLLYIKDQDWHIELEDGDIIRINRNDLTFKLQEKTVQIDYVYITIHGTPGEDGRLQGYLDMLALPYSTGGVLTEALTFDKFVLNQYLKAYGINTAESLLIRKGYEEKVDEDEIERRIGMPCFVKPASNGSSFGVSKVKDKDHLPVAIRKAMMESSEVMVERFIAGREISIGCYKTKNKAIVLPATEVITANEFFDYDAKYNGQAQEITPAELSPNTSRRVKELTSTIYDILGCNGLIRIDYILSPYTDAEGIVHERIFMLEVNTVPGMTSASFIPQQVKVAGLSLQDVLTEIVENQF